MNKSIFSIVLSLAYFVSFGQTTIDFKVGYLPNLDYTLTQKQLTETNVQYRASKDILANFKKNGIENPTISQDTSLLKSESKTGKLTNNTFTIDTEILESSTATLGAGTKFYGKSVDGNTVIDSISSPDMTSEMKQALLPTVQNMMNQIKYPNRTLAIGESFVQDNPFTLPIGDLVVEIEINSTYTLSKVQNGYGYFELVQVYVIKSASKDYDLHVNGNGAGTLQYDIENQFFTKFYLESEMDVKTQLPSFGVELNLKTITDQITDIAKPPK
ncbi:hypothetical protein N9B82_05045 [Saprospiraceae bacterium]|nr:hypothetical protein [Saprospiraceae bacterium]